MAIKFQYNKTSLQQLEKQLKGARAYTPHHQEQGECPAYGSEALQGRRCRVGREVGKGNPSLRSHVRPLE